MHKWNFEQGQITQQDLTLSRIGLRFIAALVSPLLTIYNLVSAPDIGYLA